MIGPYILTLYHLAVSEFWQGLSLLVIAAALLAILFRKRFRKAAQDSTVKLYRPRFNQRSGTPEAELGPNPVRRYASCHCLDAQYELDEDEDETLFVGKQIGEFQAIKISHLRRATQRGFWAAYLS